MSTLAYGRIVKNRGETPPDNLRALDAEAGQGDNKLITALAAIVPVEVIAGHALILAASTTKDDKGVMSINPDASTPLMWSLPVLMALSVVMFVITRGLSDWKPVDVVRAGIAPVAFLAWTALIGTSALTPWVSGVNQVVLVIVAVVIGAIAAVVSQKVAPPTD